METKLSRISKILIRLRQHKKVAFPRKLNYSELFAAFLHSSFDKGIQTRSEIKVGSFYPDLFGRLKNCIEQLQTGYYYPKYFENI